MFSPLLLCVLALLPLAGRAATNDLSTALQTGLFEEEANRNLPAALAAYEKVAKQFDQNRALAATAIFRLGEVNRKLGKTNEAAAFYQRILREFTDQDTLTKLSQQNLAGMGISQGAAETRTTLQPRPAELTPEAEELARTHKMLVQLQGWDESQQLKLLPTLVPDSEFDRLTEALRRNETSVNAATPDMVKERENISKELKRRLFQIQMTLRAREASLAKEVADQEKAKERFASAPPKSGPITAVLDEEEAEIRRIQAMIQNSPDLINAPAPTPGGHTPLATAANKGQLRVAAFLLDHGCDVGLKSGGRAALHYAAAAGHKAMVELLLSRGANVDVRDNADWTPLYEVAGRGYKAVAETLLARNADVNARASDGRTPLHRASDSGDPAMIALLLANGADINAADDKGRTPLIVAAKNRQNSKTMAALLSAQARTDIQDREGRTALSYAAELGQLENVNVLLAAKADPNAGKVNLPLHCAISVKNAGIVEALLKAGADANRANKVTWFIQDSGKYYPQGLDQVTPLALAMNEPRLDVIKLLLANKADPNGKQLGGTPLIFAALNDPELTKAFLDAGAKPNVREGSDDNTRTPLMATANPKVISLLLAAGADPEARQSGFTALLFCASQVWSGSVEVAEALLKGGANVNARYNDDRTPLHFAAAGKRKDMMELLLAHKADANARDNQGFTPLDLALGKHLAAGQGSGAVRISESGSIPTPAFGGRLGAPTADDSVADLLRQHGGRADLPNFKTIRVTRDGLAASEIVFRADTNGWNQFTLLEVVQAFYEQHGQSLLPFPDLTRLVVHRPSQTPGGQEQAISVNLLNRTNGVDCAKDLLLEFGDTVEIPAREHPLNERAVGLTQEQMSAVRACLAKQCRVVVRGEAKVIMPAGSNWSYLQWALDTAKGTILSSSDLTRVKVTRKDPKTGKATEFIVDTTRKWSATGDLWLRDGDVIEVPEK